MLDKVGISRRTVSSQEPNMSILKITCSYNEYNKDLS